MNSTTEDSTFYSDGCFTKLVELIDDWYAVMWCSLFVITQMVIILLTILYISIADKSQNVERKIPNCVEFEDNMSDDSWEMTVTESTKMIRRKK